MPCSTALGFDEEALVSQAQKIRAGGLADDVVFGLVLSDVVWRVRINQGVPNHVQLPLVENRSQLPPPLKFNYTRDNLPLPPGLTRPPRGSPFLIWLLRE